MAIQNWLKHAKDGMKAELAAAAAAKKSQEKNKDNEEDSEEEERRPLRSPSFPSDED